MSTLLPPRPAVTSARSPASDTPLERWIEEASAAETPPDELAARACFLGPLAPARRRGLSPLAWCLAADCVGAATLDRLARWEQAAGGDRRAADAAAEQLAAWLAHTAAGAPTHEFALESLGWLRAWPHVAPRLAVAARRELLELWVDTAQASAAIEPNAAPLAHQLLAGELPLTLAALLPASPAAREWSSSGLAALRRGLKDLLDGEGLPHSRHWSLLGALVACWTRGELLTAGGRSRLLTSEAREQFAFALQQLLRLLRRDGSQMLAPPWVGGRAELFAAALPLADDAAASAMAAALVPEQKRLGLVRDRWSLPDTGNSSEWAEGAILRARLDPLASRAAIAYGQRQVSLELGVDRSVLLSGAADPQLVVDGQPLAITSEWEEVCWQSDDSVDYVEIESHWTGGWRIQRQLLLAREEDFLLLADAVLGPDDAPRDIAYRCTAPLGPTVRCDTAAETHEATLYDVQARHAAALVLPLALPEWRRGPSGGRLSAVDGVLTLAQCARGARLFAPLFFDVRRPRIRQGRFTWRRLTVAENLEPLRDDVAVGFRIQCGRQQWLIYRSLAAAGNRTVLGHNLASEFLAARFEPDEVDSLIEIEAGE